MRAFNEFIILCQCDNEQLIQIITAQLIHILIDDIYNDTHCVIKLVISAQSLAPAKQLINLFTAFYCSVAS